MSSSSPRQTVVRTFSPGSVLTRGARWRWRGSNRAPSRPSRAARGRGRGADSGARQVLLRRRPKILRQRRDLRAVRAGLARRAIPRARHRGARFRADARLGRQHAARLHRAAALAPRHGGRRGAPRARRHSLGAARDLPRRPRRSSATSCASSSRRCAALEGHRAILAYLVGNEIPPDMVRWHGADRVRAFLKRLVGMVRDADPERLVSYANFPSTEYLTRRFHRFPLLQRLSPRRGAVPALSSRACTISVDRPLVLTEFGIDSIREGAAEQARILSWQIRTAFAMGVAGTFVFAWTDEWFTGGHAIEDWAFGLVDRQRLPKPAFAAVGTLSRAAAAAACPRFPRVSVVVCAYNAERTMEACLASLEQLNYPDYEVIVVNDGSRTDPRDRRALRLLPHHQPAEQGPFSRAMSAPRRRPARSWPIPTATASPIRIGSPISSPRWKRRASSRAAAPIFRRPSTVSCRRRWRCRRAARPMSC